MKYIRSNVSLAGVLIFAGCAASQVGTPADPVLLVHDLDPWLLWSPLSTCLLDPTISLSYTANDSLIQAIHPSNQNAPGGVPANRMHWPHVECAIPEVVDADMPFGTILYANTAPTPFSHPSWADDGEALLRLMDIADDAQGGLKFVFMDFERIYQRSTHAEDVVPNIEDVLYQLENGGFITGQTGQVPGDSDVLVGNYRYTPGVPTSADPEGMYNRAAIRFDAFGDHTQSKDDSPTDPNRTIDLHATYLDLAKQGLNVAMPVAYVNGTRSGHTNTAGNPYFYKPAGLTAWDSPNDAAALFWAPLEEVSWASRGIEHKPSGISHHKLIPWISTYFTGGTSVPTPPAAHDDALLQHYRLRGADGFMYWKQSVHLGYASHQDFADSMLDAWTTLDPYLDGVSTAKILNLDTNKTGAVEWSGIRTEAQVIILVSDLNSTLPGRTVTFPVGLLDSFPRVPASVTLTPGVNHQLFVFDLCPACFGDADGDGDRDADDYAVVIAEYAPGVMYAPGEKLGDLDCDGDVDIDDVLAILGVMHTPCP